MLLVLNVSVLGDLAYQQESHELLSDCERMTQLCHSYNAERHENGESSTKGVRHLEA